MMDKIQAMSLPDWLELPTWFHLEQEKVSDFKTFPFRNLKRIPYQTWFDFQTDFVDDNQLERPLTYGLTSLTDDLASIKIIHAGNTTILESVPQELLDKGLIVMDLFEALRSEVGSIHDELTSVISAEADQISAYNLSHLNGGIYIHVPDNLVVSSPIEVTWVQDNRYSVAFNKRLVVVGGQNSDFTIVERFESQGELTNTLTVCQEIIARPNSNIHYVGFDRLTSLTQAYVRRKAVVERDATLNWSIIEMNEGHTVLDIDTQLIGDGAQSHCSTIAIGDGEQKMGINAQIVNIGRNSVGHIAQRGVVLDEATLSFNGIGHILKQAKWADSQQESRILMLSSGARGDANPILLIDEFEVQAGHAASVGRVDESQLYYLMSRGLNRREAERLVTRGFLGDVLSNLKSKTLRQEMSEGLDYKLRHY